MIINVASDRDAPHHTIIKGQNDAQKNAAAKTQKRNTML